MPQSHEEELTFAGGAAADHLRTAEMQDLAAIRYGCSQDDHLAQFLVLCAMLLPPLMTKHYYRSS